MLTFTRFSIIENDSWIQLKNLAESKVLGSINYTKVNVKYIQIRSALYQIEELFSNCYYICEYLNLIPADIIC